MITLSFPDGSSRQVEAGVTPLEVAREISPRLAKAALAAEVDGALVSLDQPLQNDVALRILTWEDEGGKHVFLA